MTTPSGRGGAGTWSPRPSRWGRWYDEVARDARPGGAVCLRRGARRRAWARLGRRRPGATIRRFPRARHHARDARPRSPARPRCPSRRYRRPAMLRRPPALPTAVRPGSGRRPGAGAEVRRRGRMRRSARPGRRAPAAGPWGGAGWPVAGVWSAGVWWGAGGWGRGALPCSCTPRFLMSGPLLVRGPSLCGPSPRARRGLVRPGTHTRTGGASSGAASGRGRSTHACASLYGLIPGEREPVRDPVCICPEHPPTLR